MSCKITNILAGNHEIVFDLFPKKAKGIIPKGIFLLEDESIRYQGITFYSITSRALQQYEWLHEDIMMPNCTDIFITHIPPKNILDDNNGSEVLRRLVIKNRPHIHLFGHTHTDGGKSKSGTWTTFYNVSIFNQLKL